MRLREWKIMNASQPTGQSASQSTTNTKTTAATSSTKNSNNRDYKNRFKKLLDYVQAHSNAERDEIKKLDNNGFHYSEHYNIKGIEYDSDLVVTVSRFTDDWSFKYFMDGSAYGKQQGKGYEDLIRALSFYVNTPSVGTTEYDNLLTECVVVKNNAVDGFKLYENLWN